jgi:broad specificity phosphatase PhoE
MSTFLLVRHATTDAIGHRLVGRLPGVRLTTEGREQAQELAAILDAEPISAVYTSPLERAVETAAPIAASKNQEPIVRAGLNEVDFGEWSGLTFEALDRYPDWKRFNANRTGVRPPRGELVAEVQARMIAELEALRAIHPDGVVAVVSHGDPLKALIAYYLGLSLELLSRIDIAPASWSVLSLEEWGACLRSLNATPSRGSGQAVSAAALSGRARPESMNPSGHR